MSSAETPPDPDEPERPFSLMAVLFAILGPLAFVVGLLFLAQNQSVRAIPIPVKASHSIPAL